MKALVIAEKPSVAMALASVLGARTRKDGYVEGNGYIKNGDMRICRLCRNVGNTRFWRAQRSSSES